MATESVKILIEAEDKASAKIVAASKEVENRIKNIKDVGGKAKASTEFIGTLANTLGGSEISGYASQLAGLTEKIGQFSEVSKVGGAGAMAFKAGLIGVVGVLSFQIGNALGNLIFETDKWNKELEKSIELSKKMAAELNRLADVRVGDALAEIKLIENPEKQIEEIEKLRQKQSEAVDTAVRDIARLKKEQSTSSFDEDANIFSFMTGPGVRAAEVIRELEAATDAKEKANARFLALDKQAGDARRQIDTDKMLRDRDARDSDIAYLQNLDSQISMLQALKSDESGLAAIKEQAAQSVTSAAEEAARQKLQQIEVLKQEIDFEKQAREEKKAAIKEIADAEFAATMAAEKAFMSERDRLEEQKVLLNQGAEAAHAMRLAKQGLSEEDAKSFAKQQTELDNQKKLQENLKARESAAPLQAISSRFLTRGPTDDKMLDVAKTQLKVQQEQLVELKKKPQGPVMRDVRIQVAG